VNRQQLEHILRAGGSISATQDLVVIGSQAILGAVPDAPAELLTSMAADVYPLHAPDKADLIDGTIGELSPFHETFGYYAHGIGPETAVLPRNWQARLVKVANENTGGVTGWCLSPADLAVSKLAAGRPKDLHFVQTLLATKLLARADVETLLTELSPATSHLVADRLFSLRS